MPTTTLSRAEQVAAIHLGPINESRRRAGLAALSADEVAREFADVDRSPARKAVATRTISNTGSADSMWGGIVAQLNMTVRAKPIGLSSGRVASPAASPGSSSNRTVDWGEISRGLNEQAGLASPARRAR
jgi:hypothetical protein